MAARLVGVLAAATVLPAATSATPALAQAAPAKARPNVVFVVADTLRHDQVGFNGEGSNRTPFLDSLAARAVVFDRAYSQCPWTNPSVASMFTSRYVTQHGVTTFASPISQDEQTLAEVLRSNGYATGAAVANILIQPILGFAQGFHDFRVVGPKVENELTKGKGEEVNAAALAWIDSLPKDGKPIFLYAHYMETHIPYLPPDDLLSSALAGRPRPDPAVMNALLYNRPDNLTPEQVDTARLLYEVGVSDLDRQVRSLFEGLARRGILENSVVVFAADHGEEFYERKWWGHGKSLFNQAIRVPLFVVPPHGQARRDVSENVELIDIAPTILGLLGIAPPSPYQGRPLLRPDGSPSPSREPHPGSGASFLAQQQDFAGSELVASPDSQARMGPKRTVLVGDRKLIADTEGHLEYYDLSRDPMELNPVRDFDAIPLTMHLALDAFRQRVRSRAATGGGTAIDPATKERMRALGYAQ